MTQTSAAPRAARLVASDTMAMPHAPCKGKLDWRVLLGWLHDDQLISAEDAERVIRRFGAGSSSQHALVRLGRPAEAVRSEPRRWKGGFWWANPLEPDVHARNVETGCFDALVAGVRYRTEHPRAERPGVAPANS